MPKSNSLGQFEQLVLTAVVNLGDNAYGVSIHKRVEDFLAPKSVTLAAVYVTLDRLERKGHLSSWLSEPTAERGGRTKRCYAIEASGERALKDAMTAARRMAAAVAPVWGVPTNNLRKA
jgi:PadR family transcriptional regulator, regulatory protein PadR